MCVLFVIFNPNFSGDSLNSNVHFFLYVLCCKQLRWHMQMKEWSTCFLRNRRSCQSFSSKLRRVCVQSTSFLFLFKCAFSLTTSLHSNREWTVWGGPSGKRGNWGWELNRLLVFRKQQLQNAAFCKEGFVFACLTYKMPSVFGTGWSTAFSERAVPRILWLES